MGRAFKSTAFKVICGVCLLALGTLIYTSTYSENIISSSLSNAFVPVQTFFFEVFSDITEMIPDFRQASDIEKENAKLRSEIQVLRNMAADYYEIKRKNAQYEKYLGFKQERDDLEFISASVIGRDPIELFYGFVINKGTESGVCSGDSVITENGFVGYVSKAGRRASKVKTILAPDAKLSAIDSSSGDTGIVAGNIKLCEYGFTSLTLISAQNSIKEGDMVTTMGYSGMYPKNLPVGKVMEINYDNLSSMNYAVVEPFENIKKVRDVLVITGFHGEGEISQSAIQN